MALIAAQTAQTAYSSKRQGDARRKEAELARREADEAAREAKLIEQAARSKEETTEATTLITAAEEGVPLSIKRRLRIGDTGANF